jgi:uncharacterized protein (DUF736 family)
MSILSIPVQVKSPPQVRVSDLKAVTSTINIQLSWQAITSSPANGGEAIIDYRVYYGNSTIGDAWYVLQDSTMGLS